MARTMCGRRMILTDVRTIDESNVVQVLQKAFVTHLANKIDIDYLWKYYKGRQPILDRTKDVRPEIMNKVVVNRANEIVSFKVGYLMGEPVQYVSRGDDEIVAQNISKLNSYMLEEDKPTKDKELAEWQHIAGTAYRIVLPDKEAGVDPDAAPFEIYTLDPRFSFVVRYNDLGLPTVMGVKYVERGNGDRVFGCYTADHYYEIDSSWKILKNEEQIFGISSQSSGFIPTRKGGTIMYRFIKGSEVIATVTSPVFVFMQENGCLALTSEGTAQGVVVDGTVYHLADRASIGDEYPDVVMLKISETDYQREQEEARAATQRQNETAMAELSILVATLLGGGQ